MSGSSGFRLKRWSRRSGQRGTAPTILVWGAVFPTGSKADAVEVDHQTLREICRAVQIPVIAIGGITKDNVKELNDSGICGIAVISAIFAEKDTKEAARSLKEKSMEALGII